MKKRRFLQDEVVRENDIVRCIVVLTNGMHKTLRFAVDKFRTLLAAIKQATTFPLLSDRYRDFLCENGLNPYQISGCKFINERTGELILDL